ncbi:MAG: hypothetical protein ACI808_000757 [Paraglaciecola sp.]
MSFSPYFLIEYFADYILANNEMEIKMSTINPKLVEAVAQLGSSLKELGGNLDELKESCMASGRVPDALVDVLRKGSGDLLGSAKLFAPLRGEATIALGLSASSMEEGAWALDREAWWKVANEFNELGHQFTSLNKDFRKEAALVRNCNPDSSVPSQILKSGGDLGAAGHVFSVAADEIKYKRVNPGLMHILTSADLFISAGKGLLDSSEELKELTVNPWSDDCICGTFKWEREGWGNGRTWVLYECIKDGGLFCSVCVWQKEGRNIRFHSSEPATPEPEED